MKKRWGTTFYLAEEKNGKIFYSSIFVDANTREKTRKVITYPEYREAVRKLPTPRRLSKQIGVYKRNGKVADPLWY